MLIIREGIRSHLAEICGNTADSKIHLRQLEGGVCVLLAVDRDFFLVSAVCLYELDGLHEHTAGTAAGGIQDSMIRLDHLSNEIHDAFGRVEFALAFTFRKSKLPEEVFVDSSNDVIFLVIRVNLVNLIKERGELVGVYGKARIVIVRQGAF